PVVGYASDLLVRAGARVMFSEVTEVRDGIAQLTARAANPEVAQQLIEQMDWYDRYLGRGSADRSANTSPGNKRGGLSNIVEKAMGSIVKSGSSPIRGVVPPGERCTTPGLNFAATPASDFVCGTLQLAAGMTLHVFTTGRGTPYGLKEVPVVKVATRSDLARRWHDLMDINAGRVVDGEASIEEMCWELFHYMIDVASGRKRSCAETLKLHNSLALFNPAPITCGHPAPLPFAQRQPSSSLQNQDSRASPPGALCALSRPSLIDILRLTFYDCLTINLSACVASDLCSTTHHPHSWSPYG